MSKGTLEEKLRLLEEHIENEVRSRISLAPTKIELDEMTRQLDEMTRQRDVWKASAEQVRKSYDLAFEDQVRLRDELDRLQQQETLHVQVDSLADLPRKAVAVWGADSQIGMVSEECAELIAAVNRWKRGRIPAEKVAEEVADVYVMLAQVEEIIGISMAPFLAAKLKRLEALIAEAEALAAEAEHGGGIR